MPRSEPPPLGVTLAYLRLLQGWSQQELAAAHGMPAPVLSRYETGAKPLDPEKLEELVAPLGLSPGAIDLALGCCRQIRSGPEPPRSQEEAERWQLERAAVVVGREAGAAARRELETIFEARHARRERARARQAWAHLRARPAADWPALVAGALEYQGWALCERVCLESEHAAADKAAKALELAGLAVRIAEATPGSDGERARLRGFAWAHLANARRVAGDLPAADRAFCTARELWEAGADSPGGLDAVRMLDLEASLRRAQRRFDEALALLDRALSDNPSAENARRILLKKAFTLEQQGQFEDAVAALRLAEPLIDSRRSPRDACVHRFNLAVNLVHAGRAAEAQALLPEVWELAGELGNELDLVRARWLEARVAGGLGQAAKAIAGLEQVQSEFRSRGILYDTALSTLELASLYLDEGRNAEVRELARQTAEVLAAQRVPRETLGAFLLFFEAAERGALSTDLARELLRRCRETPRTQATG